jgi:hypothetical protein
LVVRIADGARRRRTSATSGKIRTESDLQTVPLSIGFRVLGLLELGKTVRC